MMEVLRVENGLTIMKISDRKIMIKHEVPVILSSGEVIDTIKCASRYVVSSGNPDNFVNLGNAKLTNKLSMKFGVKMKYIVTTYEGLLSELYGNGTYQRFSVIKEIKINDKSWERNYKINQICQIDRK